MSSFEECPKWPINVQLWRGGDCEALEFISFHTQQILNDPSYSVGGGGVILEETTSIKTGM